MEIVYKLRKIVEELGTVLKHNIIVVVSARGTVHITAGNANQFTGNLESRTEFEISDVHIFYKRWKAH